MFNALRILFYSISIPAVIVVALIIYATDYAPTITNTWHLTSQDIQRAKEIVGTTRLRRRGVKKLVLNEKDLNIAASYILKPFVKAYTKITLGPDEINFWFSFKLPNNLLGNYLNINFSLYKQHEFPQIRNLSFGKLTIADEFAGLVIENIIKQSQLNQYFILLGKHLKGITIHPDQIIITYFMTPASYIEAQNFLLEHAEENNAFAVYQRKLNEVLRTHDRRTRLSLADLLKPLFQFAMQRSTLETAIEENRAIIYIVSAYVNSREVFKFLSYDRRRRPYIYRVYLYGRTDLAQHFMALAAISSSGGTHLAHLLGLEKEIFDSKGGSGFSFVDLAADRAGMYFGKMATSSPENALKFQKAMAKIKDYRAFMPEARDLPERMNLKEFKARFQSVYSLAYQNVLRKIDARIKATPLYDFQKKSG
jgi:hypothetical protein